MYLMPNMNERGTMRMTLAQAKDLAVAGQRKQPNKHSPCHSTPRGLSPVVKEIVG